MGQYHKIVNLDKKQILHPHAFGDGLKMLEFGCSANGTMTALTILLACSHARGGGDLHADPDEHPLMGSWAGDRIAIVGDYAETDDFPGLTQETVNAIWDDESSEYEDISKDVLKLMCQDSYIRSDVLETAARYTWQDWSWLFTEAELDTARKEQEARRVDASR